MALPSFWGRFEIGRKLKYSTTCRHDDNAILQGSTPGCFWPSARALSARLRRPSFDAECNHHSLTAPRWGHRAWLVVAPDHRSTSSKASRLMRLCQFRWSADPTRFSPLIRNLRHMTEIRSDLARLIQATKAWNETARTNRDRIRVLETR